MYKIEKKQDILACVRVCKSERERERDMTHLNACTLLLMTADNITTRRDFPD